MAIEKEKQEIEELKKKLEDTMKKQKEEQMMSIKEELAQTMVLYKPSNSRTSK